MLNPNQSINESALRVVVCSGLSTGIYATNSPEACCSIAASAECVVIVVENDNQLQKIIKVWDQLPLLQAVVQYKGIPRAHAGRNIYSVRIFQPSVLAI